MKFLHLLHFTYLCARNKRTIFNKRISAWVNLKEH